MPDAPQAPTVVVTGASGGLGSKLVERLSAAGWQVYAGVRSPAAADTLAARDLPRVAPVRLDLTDADSVQQTAGAIERELGGRGLTALVNNAGIIVQGPLELVPLEALRRQFEVNVLGQVAVTQVFLPALRTARGRVVNIGAPTGRVPLPMLAPISASKAALDALTTSLRLELRHQGVGVTLVEPGALDTPIFAKAEEAFVQDGAAGGVAAQQHYAQAVRGWQEAMSGQRTSPAEGVADAVVRVLTGRRLRSRYTVGRDARSLVALRHAPEGLRDRLILSAMGLKPEQFA